MQLPMYKPSSPQLISPISLHAHLCQRSPFPPLCCHPLLTLSVIHYPAHLNLSSTSFLATHCTISSLAQQNNSSPLLPGYSRTKPFLSNELSNDETLEIGTQVVFGTSAAIRNFMVQLQYSDFPPFFNVPQRFSVNCFSQSNLEVPIWFCVRCDYTGRVHLFFYY
jgi:hypothetical protein